MIEIAQVVDVNHWAVVVATVVMFAIGAVWYSPVLFGKQWQEMVMKWTNLKEKDMKAGMVAGYIGTFLCYLVMAYVLAYLIGLLGAVTAVEGMVVAGWIALGFVVTLNLSHAIFHGMRKMLWAINTSYVVLGLLVMGAILGAWQ